MTDENNQEALKADESQNEVESPTTEQSDGLDIIEGPIPEDMRPDDSEGEEVESDLTEEEEAEASPDDEDEAKPSRKTAQSRIRELNAEKKQAERKAEEERVRAESLADQMKKLTSSPPEQTYDFQPRTDEESEITVDEVMRRADELVRIRMRQQDNINRVNNEAIEATKSYPELDPDSDSFDPALSEKLSRAVLKVVSADPTTSVKEFVSDYMEPIKSRLAKQEVGQREAITKQVSQQAVRPTSVQKQEKPFSELSIKEMEEKLGSVYR